MTHAAAYICGIATVLLAVAGWLVVEARRDGA